MRDTTNPLCVLIVDDEPAITEFMAIKFEAAGYRVAVAGNGAEALDWLASNRPDLIISDLHMPFVDGLELCRRLELDASTRSIPVLLLTAQVEIGVRPANVIGVIEKPFNAAQVVTRSIEVLGSIVPIQSRARRG